MTLTLSNDAVVTLDAADGVTDNEDGTFSIGGDYVVGSEDLDTFSDEDANTLELSIVSYTPDILDVSGNAVATDLVISEFDNVTDHVIDTTAPQLTVATWVAGDPEDPEDTDQLVLAFNEQIDATSITNLTAALQGLATVDPEATIINQGDGNITFKINSTEVAGTIDIGDFDVTDLAGNITTITELDIV